MHRMELWLDIYKRDFRWLWLMYLTGFDERFHCQPCLKGKKTQRLHYDDQTIVLPFHTSFTLDEFPAFFVYLCGVTTRYEDNLHIAMRHVIGPSVEYRDSRIAVRVLNAQQIPILPVDVDKPEEFVRCRNFQFGYRYLGKTSPQQMTLLSTTE